MNKELLLLIRKHTDTLIEQTQTRPQETLEFKLNKQTETFSFNPPINLVEENKWLPAGPSFEATNSVFNIIDENNSFSSGIPGHWNSGDGEEANNKFKKSLEIRSGNDIDLHVNEIEKRGTRKEIENIGYNLAGFDHFKSKILTELKRVKFKDLEDMVYRKKLTCNEI